MSHPTTFWHVLWDGLRHLYRKLKRVVAGASEHDGQALVVDATAATVRAALGRRYFGPNWHLSYYERGEVLNLARVEYDAQTVLGHEFVWWQTHVRVWEHGEGTVRLRCHYELEPSMNDQDHLEEIGLDVDRGIDVVASALDDAGIEYEHHDDLPVGGTARQ